MDNLSFGSGVLAVTFITGVPMKSEVTSSENLWIVCAL